MSEETGENDVHIDHVYVDFSSAMEICPKSEVTNDSGIDSEYSSSFTIPTESATEIVLAEEMKNTSKKEVKISNEIIQIEEANASLSSPISVSPDINDATENLLSFEELSLNKIDNILSFTDQILTEDEELNIEELIKEAGIVCAEEASNGSTTDSTNDLEVGSHPEIGEILKITNDYQSNLKTNNISNLTTSTVSLNEQKSSLSANKTISKSPYSKSAENVSTIDQNVDPNLNSSSKELNTDKILSQFASQKNKVTATQKIPDATVLPHKPVLESYTNLDLGYARLPKELLSQDLGSIVKNVHGIFSSVSGSLKNAYIYQRAPKPTIKNVVKPIPNGKVMNDIFEDESIDKTLTMCTIEKPLEIPTTDESLKLAGVEGSEPESNAKKDVLKIETLERLLSEQRKENTILRERVIQQIEELQQKDQTFKELDAKLDMMGKRVEHAEREKDAAVMRYASVECTAIEARRAAEKASAVEKAALVETELLANKLKSAHAEKQRICQLYDDKPEYLDDVTDFEVVMFNAVGVRRKEVHRPPKRSPHQKYVFCSQESSTNYPLTPGYDDFINWTWTYKFNSDIVCPYIAVRNSAGDLIGPKPNMYWLKPWEMKPTSKRIKRKLRNKKIAAAWFVSHCGARSLRLDFVRLLNQELAKYGHRVDVFGECGNLTCPLREMEECYAYIETDYYFYLAFENSFAVDYVSEKLLTAVEHYAVPIVFGGANYSRFMPYESYIDAKALGPVLLARKMVEIIKDKKKYVGYFRWHRYYSLHDTDENPETDVWCIFCKYLNDNLKMNKTTTYPDLVRWYNEPRDWPPRVLKESNEPNVFVKFLTDLFNYFSDV